MITTNYDQFKLFKYNRPIQNAKIKNFINVFDKIGYINNYPVLVKEVNGYYFIIDGQHRYFACKLKKMPIVFNIDKSGVDPSILMKELNCVQDTWRLGAFINLHSSTGKKFYSDMMAFEELYKLGISNTISICTGLGTSPAKKIRDGIDFKFNDKAHEIATFILSCKFLNFYKSSKFVRAVVILYKKANSKHIGKLLKHHMAITEQVSVPAYLAIFENIINKNVPPSQRFIIK